MRRTLHTAQHTLRRLLPLPRMQAAAPNLRLLRLDAVGSATYFRGGWAGSQELRRCG